MPCHFRPSKLSPYLARAAVGPELDHVLSRRVVDGLSLRVLRIEDLGDERLLVPSLVLRADDQADIYIYMCSLYYMSYGSFYYTLLFNQDDSFTSR